MSINHETTKTQLLLYNVHVGNINTNNTVVSFATDNVQCMYVMLGLVHLRQI